MIASIKYGYLDKVIYVGVNVTALLEIIHLVHAQNFLKNYFLPPDIHAYVSFSENFAYVLSEWSLTLSSCNFKFSATKKVLHFSNSWYLQSNMRYIKLIEQFFLLRTFVVSGVPFFVFWSALGTCFWYIYAIL